VRLSTLRDVAVIGVAAAAGAAVFGFDAPASPSAVVAVAAAAGMAFLGDAAAVGLRAAVVSCCGWWRARVARVAARERYFGEERALRRVWRGLAREAGPRERAELLREAAGRMGRMAGACPGAFGPEPIEWEGGRDLAESQAFSAALLRVLAQVEDIVRGAVAGGDVGLADAGLAGVATPEVRAVLSTPVALAVLKRMAATPDLAERHPMLRGLYHAVEPVVGGQAAETVACLPAPGFPHGVLVGAAPDKRKDQLL
jgi:hypothetical protein